MRRRSRGLSDALQEPLGVIPYLLGTTRRERGPVYVREKTTTRGDKTYSYFQLVEGERVDGRVRQKVGGGYCARRLRVGGAAHKSITSGANVSGYARSTTRLITKRVCGATLSSNFLRGSGPGRRGEDEGDSVG